MTLRPLALVAALLGLGWAGAARACSVVSDYVRPSNFELVQIADAIVVATAESASGREAVNFRIDQAVKGATPQRLAIGWATIGTTTPSDLNDLSGSNPEGGMGGCNRMTFARGGRYLLFLAREPDGRWRQLAYPFSRINEDYRGEDTIWMRTVRRYVALQQRLAPMAQIEALAAMQASGRTPDGQTLAPSERTDIADHFSSISEWKPTAWLLRVYEQAERGAAVAMRPESANRERGDVDALTSLALGAAPTPDRPEGSEGVRRAVLTALAAGDHPDALPLIDRLWAAPGISPGTRGLALRFYVRNGQFPRAYQWIEGRLMAHLQMLERQDAMRLIRDVALTMGEDGYAAAGDPPARWRGDPHAAATWPELALSLYWFQANSFGPDYALPLRGAIRTLPVSDFRARPLLTLALGHQHDERVSAWAIAELARPPVPSADGREVYGRERLNDPAILPLRVLVGSHSPAHTAALTRLFCEGGARRRLAILAIGQWGISLYSDLLIRMAGFPRLDEHDRYELRKAAIEMTAREIGEGGEIGLLGGDDRDWLVTRLLSRQPPPQPLLPEERVPLTCPA